MTVLEVLEFDQLLAILRRYIASPLGEAAGENIHPLPDRAQAESELADLAEALAYLALQSRDREGAVPQPSISFHGIHHVRPAAERLRIEGAALGPLQIFQLLETLDRARDIKSLLDLGSSRFPRLARLAGCI